MITSKHILRTEYVPRRITGDNSRKLAPKTMYNIYVSLASYFTWMSREFDIPNPIKNVPRPRVPDDPPVEPFQKDEIELLIKACDFCNEAETDMRRKFTTQRSTAKRDKAILLTLLDSGLRASELCALLVGDVDFKTGKGLFFIVCFIFINKLNCIDLCRRVVMRQTGNENLAISIRKFKWSIPNWVRLI